MNKLLSKANILMRKNRPLDNPNEIITVFRRNNFLQLTFQSNGCRYSAAGSCSMCNYGKGKTATLQEILSKLETICQTKDFKECDMILLGASGSFLDDQEIPNEYQHKIMERIAKSHIHEIYIETHYKSITIPKLHIIRKLFPNQYINIEMGLETITAEYQINILNKKIPLNELSEVIKQIHSVNMFVSLNVLVGIPFLSEKEQLTEALKTLRWALNNKADYVVLFPINIQPYSLFEWWHKNNYISVPSLWMLVFLLSELSDEEMKHVCFAWYGNRCITYSDERKTQTPQACPLCRKQLIDFFETFSNDFNVENRKLYLKQLQETNFKCNCYRNLYTNIEKSTKKYPDLKSGHIAIENLVNGE